MNTRERLKYLLKSIDAAIEKLKIKITKEPDKIDEFINKILSCEKSKLEIKQAIRTIDLFVDSQNQSEHLPDFDYEKFRELNTWFTAYVPSYDEETGGVCFVDGNGFLMEYDLMVQVLRGLTIYLSKHSKAHVEVQNHQQLMRLNQEMEEFNNTPRVRVPTKGYVLIIYSNSGGYKFLYGSVPKGHGKEETLEQKLKKRLSGLQGEFMTDVEVVKQWEKVSDLHKFIRFLRERFAHRRDKEKPCYNLTKGDVEVIKEEKFESKALNYLYGDER